MSLTAIIVAGGSGTRMGKGTKKQYLPLAGLPVMGHSLRLFDRVPEVASLVLVLPKEDLESVEKEIVPKLDLQKKLLLVPGGASRQESVYCGIGALAPETSLVLVHDAVRPFVRQDQIAQLVDAAKKSGAASLAVPVVDTLRRQISNNQSEALSREKVFAMQTPQAFRADLLKKAHERALALGISGTDDAGLVADMGHPLVLVEGSRTNIKITEKEDLLFAEAFSSLPPIRQSRRRH